MSKSSLALDNLRAIVILVVLAFHSALAYLASLPPAPLPFDSPPYRWLAFPMIDSQRWLGFDVFCAWQDVYLMTLLFFLSGLFVWPSLTRKGIGSFLYDRLLRLGLPFAMASAFLAPLALYPVYRVTAADPGVVAFWRHWLALPFWPSGPAWFLWQLLALNIAAAGLYRFAPRGVEALARFASAAAARPAMFFSVLACASAVAYVPLAYAFTPWAWSHFGPFALQISRPLHYAVYFFAGVAVGAYGLERGLLASDGALARRWATWIAPGVTLFLLWIGLTALTRENDGGPALAIAAAFSYVLACASSCLVVLAICLRFGTGRSPVFDSLKNNAYGMYLVHYVFVVWLQYALLDSAMIAIVKVTIVFSGALLLSWTAAAAIRRAPMGARLIGAARPELAKAVTSSPGEAVSTVSPGKQNRR